MIKGVILDTNIAIGLLNDNRKVVEMIQLLRTEMYEFYFSVITKCELISGIKNELEMKAVKSIEHSRFIEVNNEIATIAGEIRLEQKKEENRVIKAPDSLIIATAIYRNYDLFTFDKGMWFAERYNIKLIKEHSCN